MSDEEKATSHTRARGTDEPDPEHLAADLDRLAAKLGEEGLPASERSYLQDQLGLLASRCQWVQGEQQRTFLEEKVDALWEQVGELS